MVKKILSDEVLSDKVSMKSEQQGDIRHSQEIKFCDCVTTAF